MYKTRKALYVKRNIVARSHDALCHENTTVLSFLPLTQARPCKQCNTYLKICVLFIAALRTSLPVTGNTLRASCKVSDIVVRLKQV
jgi:hypothetical protein